MYRGLVSLSSIKMTVIPDTTSKARKERTVLDPIHPQNWQFPAQFIVVIQSTFFCHYKLLLNVSGTGKPPLLQNDRNS